MLGRSVPKAWELIRPLLRLSTETCLFCPREAEATSCDPQGCSKTVNEALHGNREPQTQSQSEKAAAIRCVDSNRRAIKMRDGQSE